MSMSSILCLCSLYRTIIFQSFIFIIFITTYFIVIYIYLLLYIFHLCMGTDACQEQKCFSNTVDPTLNRVVSFLAWILVTKFCFTSRLLGLLTSEPSLQFRWRHLHSTTTVSTTFIVSSLLLMISQIYLQICILLGIFAMFFYNSFFIFSRC